MSKMKNASAVDKSSANALLKAPSMAKFDLTE